VPRDTQFLPHPSNTGTQGYDIPIHQFILKNYQDGCPVPASLMKSIKHWTRHLVPWGMTGNKTSSELSGEYLFLLILFKMILGGPVEK
jgi:hypothetical protein